LRCFFIIFGGNFGHRFPPSAFASADANNNNNNFDMAAILQYRRIAALEAIEATSDMELQGSRDEGPQEVVLAVEAKADEAVLNARLWPLYQRALYTVLVTMVGFIVSWAGAITSAASKAASEDFHVSETVESLATGLYFIGFGLGSLAAGPVSETFGRNVIYIVAM
jgi:hypothetical protein